MRIYPNKLKDALLHNASLKAILIYGSNQELIRRVLMQVTQRLDMEAYPTPWVSESALETQLNSPFLMLHRVLLVIENAPSALSGQARKLLLRQNLHMPVFVASNLSNKASICKMFEQEEDLLSVHCLQELPKERTDAIKTTIAQCNLTIGPEAIGYLCQTVPQELLTQEALVQLCTYAKSLQATCITQQHCENLFSQSKPSRIESLCIYHAHNDYRNFHKELDLSIEAPEPILILRCLQRYYAAMLTVLALQDEFSMEQALLEVDSFYAKDLTAFRRAMQHLNREEIVFRLEGLFDLEIKFKESTISDRVLLSSLLR